MPAQSKPQAQGFSGEDRRIRVFVSSTFLDRQAELKQAMAERSGKKAAGGGFTRSKVDLNRVIPCSSI
jgi:hypothetical protein